MGSVTPCAPTSNSVSCRWCRYDAPKMDRKLSMYSHMKHEVLTEQPTHFPSSLSLDATDALNWL